MRFKYLTASFLRNAAEFIDAANGEEFMCHCIEGWRQDKSVRPGDINADNRLGEFKQVWREMNMQFDGNLLENGKDETEECGFVPKEWKQRNDQRVMFLLMLADAIAYKSNGGKKVKPVPPPMILPDRGMVFTKEPGIDRYTAKNAYGTFVMQRGNPNSTSPDPRAKTDRWCLIDPNGQVIVDNEVFRNQIASDYRIHLQR